MAKTIIIIIITTIIASLPTVKWQEGRIAAPKPVCLARPMRLQFYEFSKQQPRRSAIGIPSSKKTPLVTICLLYTSDAADE